jgi:hypothetical protein
LSRQEWAFVESLLVHVAYEKSKGVQGVATVPMTDRQLMALLQARHGVKLYDEKDLRRLKQKFITRGRMQASMVELLVLEQVGVRGTPSRYRLTGLAGAFGQGRQRDQQGGADPP